ncbi:MAG: (Fe-S)-binding protein [Promethearchaeota archaeon]
MKFKSLKKYKRQLKYCNLCSTCSPSCPSYEAFGWESYTPRARMMLSRYYLEGVYTDVDSMSDRMFNCSMCASCSEACPAPHDPWEIIRSTRIELWAKGAVPERLKQVISSVEQNSNPFQLEKESRNSWSKGVEEYLDDESDVILFQGCIPAYKNGPSLQKLAKVYAAMGTPFRLIPGNKEVCCGLPALDAGNVELFNKLMSSNIERLLELNPKKIVFACPSCYSFIREYYRKESDEFAKIDLVFYTDDVLRGVKEKKLALEGFDGPVRVTYHDPCHLGRFSKLWDSPREIIKQIPNCDYVELDNSREKTSCCGSGGGLMVVNPPTNNIIANKRIKEVVDKHAGCLINTCFTCQDTLQGAAFRVETASDLEVVHLLDLLKIK